jgi:hypothetical protein
LPLNPAPVLTHPSTTRAGASPRYRRQAHKALGLTAGSRSRTRSTPVGLRWPRSSCAAACRCPPAAPRRGARAASRSRCRRRRAGETRLCWLGRRHSSAIGTRREACRSSRTRRPTRCGACRRRSPWRWARCASSSLSSCVPRTTASHAVLSGRSCKITGAYSSVQRRLQSCGSR